MARAPLALLALLPAAFITLSLLAVLAARAVAEPVLLVASPSASLRARSNSSYLLDVELPPLAFLSREKIACALGASIARAWSSVGEVEVKGGCVYLTVRNPTPRPLRLEVEVELLEPESTSPEPPVAAVAAAAVLAAASYLTLTESGRQKLFTALSLPASYFITRYGDVTRNAKRVKILEYIRANPGVTVRRISRETGISYGEVQWHLSVLERFGLIQKVKIGKRDCYFLSGTPLEVWLPQFARRELRAEIDATTLEKIKPKLEAYATRGKIPVSELLSLEAAPRARRRAREVLESLALGKN